MYASKTMLIFVTPRNCLIGKDLQLKISDFGLTRDVYTDEYYKVNVIICINIEMKALKNTINFFQVTLRPR